MATHPSNLPAVLQNRVQWCRKIRGEEHLRQPALLPQQTHSPSSPEQPPQQMPTVRECLLCMSEEDQ